MVNIFGGARTLTVFLRNVLNMLPSLVVKELGLPIMTVDDKELGLPIMVSREEMGSEEVTCPS